MVHGTVSAITPTSITVSVKQGKTASADETIVMNDQTVLDHFGRTITSLDIQKGDRVSIQLFPAGGSVLLAQQVDLVVVQKPKRVEQKVKTIKAL